MGHVIWMKSPKGNSIKEFDFHKAFPLDIEV